MKLSYALISFSIFAGISASSIAKTTASSMKVILDDFSELAKLYEETVIALNDFPRSGSQGAANIHNNEVQIESLFENVNTELGILPKPVSQHNAEKIINTYQSFTPAIIQSLNEIAAKAPGFMTVKAANTMSADVLTAALVCSAFTENIMAMTPASMTSDVNAMFAELTAARQGASAALATVLSG